MVEAPDSDNDGGWEDSNMDGVDDDDDWGAAAEQNGEPDNFMAADIEIPMRNEKGYKPVKSEEVSKEVVIRIQELEDLYALPIDPLIIIAQNYNWNPDKMQEWLLEEHQDRLKFKLGVEFD